MTGFQRRTDFEMKDFSYMMEEIEKSNLKMKFFGNDVTSKGFNHQNLKKKVFIFDLVCNPKLRK
jgi:hypothetical protein